MKFMPKGTKILSLVLVLAALVSILPSSMIPVHSAEVDQTQAPAADAFKKYIGCDAYFVGYSVPMVADPTNAGNPFAIVPVPTGSSVSVKLIIQDCYYDKDYDSLWYKVAAAPNQEITDATVKKALEETPWVFLDYVIGSWNDPTLRITEPKVISGAVTDSEGKPVLGSNGKPLEVTVSGGLPAGAKLEVSVPEINGEKLPNVFDIKVYDKNGNEWQPIDEGRTVTVSIPVDDPTIVAVDVAHYIDHADAIHDGVEYVSIDGADAAVLALFNDAIEASDCEKHVAVEIFGNINISDGKASFQTGSFSLYTWNGTKFIPQGTETQTTQGFPNYLSNDDMIVNMYYATKGHTFIVETNTIVTNSYDGDSPFDVYYGDAITFTKGNYQGTYTTTVQNAKRQSAQTFNLLYKRATFVIPDTAAPGETILIRFKTSAREIYLLIKVVDEVTITLNKNLDKATLANTSYGPVPTDGDESKNLFSIPTDAGYIPKSTDAHYTFVGWNTSPDGTGISYIYDEKNKTFSPSAFTPMMDMTLYAMWSSENSVVKFDPNGGEGTYDDVPAKTGTSIILPQGPTRKDYVFLGWSATKDGYSMPFAAGAEYTVNQDTTLYAIWGVELTVSYSGGTLLLQKEGDFKALPLSEHEYSSNGQKLFYNEPEVVDGVTTYKTILLEGFLKNARFTFEYDKTYKAETPSAYGASIQFTNQASQIIAETTDSGINVITGISFSAVEQGYKSYTVSYVTNYGSSVSPTILTGRENDTLYLQALPPKGATTRMGHTFEGWYLDAALTREAAVPMKITENTTLYAKWTVNSHQVTWVVDGVITEETYEFGTKLTSPAQPNKEGYTFTGWDGYTEGMTMPDEDIIISAKFTINQYTVKWLDGFGAVLSEEKLNYGAEITAIEAPQKIGYFFAGWDKKIPETVPAGDVTITAVYEKIAYTVSFLENTGNPVAGVDEITFYVDTILSVQIPVAEKAGCNFLGWYTDATLTTPCTPGYLQEVLETQNNSTEITIKLYAKWETALSSLTISVSGCQEDKDPEHAFIFTVEGNGVTLRVTIVGNGSVTIDGVQIGEKYTVTLERTWRYGGASVEREIKVAVSDNAFEFTVTRNNDYWLDGSDHYPDAN